MSPLRPITGWHLYRWLLKSETDSLNEQKESSHAHFIPSNAAPLLPVVPEAGKSRSVPGVIAG